jgi:hypothetical protein
VTGPWVFTTALVSGAMALASGPLAARAQTHGESGAELAAAPSWAELAQPTPLSPEEEASPAGAVLARRFNPAMAFVHEDIWPVPVSYAWADGAGLSARVMGSDGRVLREAEALTHEALAAHAWGDLPDADPEGKPLHYFVDGPGDDRLSEGVSTWRRRWRALVGNGPDAHLRAAPHALPTQHAHLFWLNRSKGLLAIQYWFYFPYNEWINHHEGDWEHINVILRGPRRLGGDADFYPIGYQFFFHEFVHEPTRVVRVGGSDPREDHVVVYTGGRTKLYGWSGSQSGGSYPLPALYPSAGGGLVTWRPHDDTRGPVRFIRPEDFVLVMMPEPDRLDVGMRPELGWLRLAFFAGQAVMHRNPLALNGISFGTPSRQPARQETWNADYTPPAWQGQPQFDPRAQAVPRDWVPLMGPPRMPDEAPLSARRSSKPNKRRR